ncbi:MAG TPA: methionine biosynthesis protein MetW, partial [Alcanivorax sp.]|nr:methionine biosynthesis protein MetW [Alcanivorax sp.]
MRDDLQLISDWIPADASLLDLGCGDGTLLAHLQHHKQIRGYGLEINQDNLAACFEKGVNVLEQDLDEGLGNFQNHRFDYVVMTQAL